MSASEEILLSTSNVYYSCFYVSDVMGSLHFLKPGNVFLLPMEQRPLFAVSGRTLCDLRTRDQYAIAVGQIQLAVSFCTAYKLRMFFLHF